MLVDNGIIEPSHAQDEYPLEGTREGGEGG